MANTIQYATKFQENLDKMMVQKSVTGWMEANAGQVKYDGGKEVKIPKISTNGLGNYDRSNNKNGYPTGAIDFGYETFTMKYDRGREFLFDAMDVNETNFGVTAGSVMSTFQNEHVVPEVDALRISTLASIAVENGQTISDKGKKGTEAIKDAITQIREAGFEGELVVHCTYEYKNKIEKELMGVISPINFAASKDGVTTQVPSIDGCPLIATTSNRMVSKIKLLDGKTSQQEQGGFEKAEDAKDINFIVIARSVPIAVSKTDKMRIFDPDTYQGSNAWKCDYRKYHDVWVMENKRKGVIVCLKDK